MIESLERQEGLASRKSQGEGLGLRLKEEDGQGRVNLYVYWLEVDGDKVSFLKVRMARAEAGGVGGVRPLRVRLRAPQPPSRLLPEQRKGKDWEGGL